MGCNQGKDTSQFMYQYPEEKLSKITSAKDFQFTNDIFINEHYGSITKEYQIVKQSIGKGAYGDVKRARHKKTQLERAIKIIQKQSLTKDEITRLINEVNILKSLDHPNILKIYEFFQDDQAFYIVSELCQGGELFEKIILKKNFSERKAAQTMKQILSAISYCHSRNIVHRDIKPENLLYESKKSRAQLKVIDFGTSRIFKKDDEKMNQKFGTPYYIAPEVIKKKYNEKCDIWSCGIILYVLLCGYPPFNGANEQEIMTNVLKGQFKFEGVEWIQISDQVKNLIKKMLEYDPNRRITAEQALADEWITKYSKLKEADIPLMQSALENMKKYQATKKLSEATWLYMVSYLTTNDELKQLQKTFQQLDLNGDGQLSKEELVMGFLQTMGGDEQKAIKEVNKIMKIVDKNNNGLIDYSEFLVASIDKKNLLTEDRIQNAFKILDKDGSGLIDLNEFKEVYGKTIPDNVWKDMIKEIDENGDGEISFEEFKNMLTSVF